MTNVRWARHMPRPSSVLSMIGKIGKTEMACTPNFTPGKNPIPGVNNSKLLKEILNDLYGQYDQVSDAQKRLVKLVGKERAKEIMATLKKGKKALKNCAAPICLLECYLQFLDDQANSINNVLPWQRCGLELSESDCDDCCFGLESNVHLDDCFGECQQKWSGWD